MLSHQVHSHPGGHRPSTATAPRRAVTPGAGSPISKCPPLQHRRWGVAGQPAFGSAWPAWPSSISYFRRRGGERQCPGPLRGSATDLRGARISVTRKLLSPPCHSAPGELAPKRVCVGDLIYCLSIRAESH